MVVCAYNPITQQAETGGLWVGRLASNLLWNISIDEQNTIYVLRNTIERIEIKSTLPAINNGNYYKGVSFCDSVCISYSI